MLLGNINGRQLTSPVTKEDPPEGIEGVPNVTVALRPLAVDKDTFNIVSGTFHLIDCGGTGDCFIRSFNHAYKSFFQLEPYSSQSWYKLFGIPTSEYLEAEHISSIAAYYKVCICVLRTHQGEIWPQAFGLSTGHPWFYFYNEYPSHYYEMSMHAELESDSESSDSHSSESDQSENSDSDLSVLDLFLPRAPPYKTLVSYLIHSEGYRFSRPFQAVSAFKVVHFEVCQMILSLLA
jgi:hypothetical protein